MVPHARRYLISWLCNNIGADKLVKLNNRLDFMPKSMPLKYKIKYCSGSNKMTFVGRPKNSLTYFLGPRKTRFPCATPPSCVLISIKTPTKWWCGNGGGKGDGRMRPLLQAVFLSFKAGGGGKVPSTPLPLAYWVCGRCYSSLVGVNGAGAHPPPDQQTSRNNATPRISSKRYGYEFSLNADIATLCVLHL
jgi:hypothetical protein